MKNNPEEYESCLGLEDHIHDADSLQKNRYS